jgi:glycosyltransferase involved in cell wall biosynthesis
MKILFTVEFYEPHKGGAEEVVRQLAERLVKKGHNITVATTFLPARKENNINGVKIESFRISGNAVRGIFGNAEEIKRYRDFLQGDFDVVINYAAQIWTTDLAFLELDNICAKKILVPCGYSALRDISFKKYFAELPAILKKYGRLVYMSPNYQDKIFGDQSGAGDKAIIIPNGAAAEEFLAADEYRLRQKLKIKTKYLAICVANHYRDKGHGFVIEAFKKMERGDATLLIIGQNPGNTALRKIKQFFTGCQKACRWNSLISANIRLMPGSNRQAVISAYKNADVFLFGSKVECAPLVMYESFASKTAFISTPVGNVPDYGGYVKIVKTPDEMAEAANFLLDHPAEKNTLTEKAFRLWQDSYTWDKIADKYEKLLIL